MASLSRASWQIFLLGGLRAQRGDVVVEHFRSQKIGQLLAYLALNSQRLHTREELCELLWPDAEIETARANLRTALAALRKSLDHESLPLVRTEGYSLVGLYPDAFTTDVAEFERALQNGALSEATTLYTGPLLPRTQEVWANTERDRLRDLYLAALSQLVQRYEAQGALSDALATAERALAVDPLREESQGEVIRLLLRSGESAAAQRHFDSFAQLLEKQLGISPSQELRDILKTTKPAVRAQPSVPPTATVGSSLPVPLTRFFGRQEELVALEAVLTQPAVRLLTLTGPGGSGKTRLAIELSRRVRERFPEGVVFVPLADVRDSLTLPEAILRRLSSGMGGALAPQEQLIATLKRTPGRRLLVLDNLEHLIEPAADLVTQLLTRVPGLTLLVTSRVQLRCEGEQVFSVAPLRLPPSIELFVNRVQAIRPDFQHSESNAEAVATLCMRLEGIPLALELAASRAQMLTPRQILERLDQRLDFLVSRKRDTKQRHQTLRAAIDWSYKLLDPELQRFFAQLCVFRGGWTLEAAEHVCQEPLALDYLAHLRECSLIQAEEVTENMRFRMLETLREYAKECLSADDEALVFQRHQEYFLALARESAPHIQGAQQAHWLPRLEADHDNFRAIFERCQARPEDATAGLQLGSLLLRFWWARGHFTEGRARLTTLLECGAIAPPMIRADALIGRAMLATAQNDYATARSDIEAGLLLSREENHPAGIASALNILSIIVREQGDYLAARDYLEEALTLRQQLGDRYGAAAALNNLGNVYFNLGDEPKSSQYYRQALAINREIGNDLWIGNNLNNLGVNSYQAGNYAQARDYYEEALCLRRPLNDRQGIASSLLSLGGVYIRLEEPEKAREALAESLQYSKDIGRKSFLTEGLQKFGFLALHVYPEQGATLAVLLFAAAESQVQQMGFTQTTMLRERVESGILQARQVLGDATYESVWQEGYLLSLDQAIELALTRRY